MIGGCAQSEIRNLTLARSRLPGWPRKINAGAAARCPKTAAVKEIVGRVVPGRFSNVFQSRGKGIAAGAGGGPIWRISSGRTIGSASRGVHRELVAAHASHFGKGSGNIDCEPIHGRRATAGVAVCGTGITRRSYYGLALGVGLLHLSLDR